MQTLGGVLRDAGGLENRMLWGGRSSVSMAAAATGSCLGDATSTAIGQSVLLRTHDQFSAALALIELDGVARRLILCPPDLADEHLPTVIRDGEVDLVVTDRGEVPPALEGLPHLRIGEPVVRAAQEPAVGLDRTEWVMFTSGTTGPPKMVVHDLEGLTGAIKPMGAMDRPVVWATFYDIRRYGGLQIFFRGLLSGGSMVIAGPDEGMLELIDRMGAHAVTHVSGTPSHWRKALASGRLAAISPAYARLSGEIADQPILNQLKRTFPGAGVGHAYASTEAGVGFEVNDGLEGFPATVLAASGGAVEMRVIDGSLRVRSKRTANRYLGAHAPVLMDAEGFVDTGDMVELRGDRYYFAGRRGGIINVGGLKVHPEEVEAVVNSYPGVRMSLASSRRNAMTGAIVVADVVLELAPEEIAQQGGEVQIRKDILSFCRERMAPYKVPAMLRFVEALKITQGGKLLRDNP